MAVLTFATALKNRVPPWLRNGNAGKIVGGIGDVLDALQASVVNGVKARFPVDESDPDALSRIGKDRRIRRGPIESAATYAGRLRLWLESHKRRGSPYAMLAQLIAFWKSSISPRMDVVAQSGNRHYALAGASSEADVVHDAITWGGDGTGKWAHLWVFFYLTEYDTRVVTSTDEGIVTETGDELVATINFAGVLDDVDIETFSIVPREWSAAHVPYVTVVLLYDDEDGAHARLWGYPTPAPDTWGAVDGGRTWGSPDPVILIVD